MAIRRILSVAACLATMVATVTACGSAHHNATTAHADTAAVRPEWDPCTGIDPDTLRRAGLHPASVEADSAGAAYPGWKVCSWEPPNVHQSGPTSYYVTVFSTNNETVDHIRHKSINNHLADVTITGRPALQYHLGGGDPGETCAIAFATTTDGVVLVVVERNPAGRYFEPVCTTTRRTATALLPTLPR